MPRPSPPRRQTRHRYRRVRADRGVGLTVAGTMPLAILAREAGQQAAGAEVLRIEIVRVDQSWHDDFHRLPIWDALAAGLMARRRRGRWPRLRPGRDGDPTSQHRLKSRKAFGPFPGLPGPGRP